MLGAALWGLVGGAALLVGAVLGLVSTPSRRALGLITVLGFTVVVLLTAG